MVHAAAIGSAHVPFVVASHRWPAAHVDVVQQTPSVQLPLVHSSAALQRVPLPPVPLQTLSLAQKYVLRQSAPVSHVVLHAVGPQT